MPNKGPGADLQGEMRWDLALRRRCLSKDIAGLMTYEAAALWHEVMKAAYLADAVPGYRKAVWVQLLSAERNIFSEGCRYLFGWLQGKAR